MKIRIITLTSHERHALQVIGDSLELFVQQFVQANNKENINRCIPLIKNQKCKTRLHSITSSLCGEQLSTGMDKRISSSRYYYSFHQWMSTLITRFMGPTWGPSGANMGPILLVPCVYISNKQTSCWSHVYTSLINKKMTLTQFFY